MKLVYIKWIDAHSETGWKNEKELKEYADKEDCIVEEVGWLFKETKHCIVLVSRKLEWTIDNLKQYGLIQKIPKTWIIKRKVLTL